jgi:acyl-CoA synthetase (AMP-forming)/AMP-acid ligase II
MMHMHSLGRATRNYPEWTVVASCGIRSNFRKLHDRVRSIAAALRNHGFKRGGRLATLLPNEPEYIELTVF